jgi:dUTP pyrophosphatase
MRTRAGKKKIELRVNVGLTAFMPTRAHRDDSGLDLYATEDVGIPPGATVRIDTWISVELPEGFEGQVRPRSSLASSGIYALLGTIDHGYRGVIGVILTNLSKSQYVVKRGDRIAQLVVCPVALPEVIQINEVPLELPIPFSSRGVGGFGSTGK